MTSALRTTAPSCLLTYMFAPADGQQISVKKSKHDIRYLRGDLQFIFRKEYGIGHKLQSIIVGP